MRKILALVAVAGLISAASAAFGATIVTSKHDLSTTGSANLGGSIPNVDAQSTQICIYCHAPHNALVSLPLWNRTNPDGSGFVLYSGVGMENVSFKSGFTSDSTSLFCMSCHDGGTNMNAIHNAGAAEGLATTNAAGGRTATVGVFRQGTVTGPANLTTDLSKTHPINFPVALSPTVSQSDLWVGSGSKMGYSTTWPDLAFPLFKSTLAGSAVRTTTDRSLECGSCHAVHDSAFKPFLRATLGGSQLCLGCHNK